MSSFILRGCLHKRRQPSLSEPPSTPLSQITLVVVFPAPSSGHYPIWSNISSGSRVPVSLGTWTMFNTVPSNHINTAPYSKPGSWSSSFPSVRCRIGQKVFFTLLINIWWCRSLVIIDGAGQTSETSTSGTRCWISRISVGISRCASIPLAPLTVVTSTPAVWVSPRTKVMSCSWELTSSLVLELVTDHPTQGRSRMDGPSQLPSPHPPTNLAKSSSDLQLQYLLLVLQNQLDCSPSLPTEPQLRLEAAKSTTEFAQLGLLGSL